MIAGRDLPLWFMLAADHAAGAGLAEAGRLTQYRTVRYLEPSGSRPGVF